VRQPPTIATRLAAANRLLSDRPGRARRTSRRRTREFGPRVLIPLRVLLLVLLLGLAAVVAGRRAVDEGRSGTAVDDSLFETISAGRRHVLALDAQGRIWSWGSNDHGQLGTGDGTFVPSREGTVFLSGADAHRPARVDIPGTFVAVAAGDQLSLAVDDRGRLWRWGAVSDDGPCEESCGPDDVVAAPVVVDLVEPDGGPMMIDAGSIIGTRLFVRSALTGSVYLVNARSGSTEPAGAIPNDLDARWAAVAVGDHHSVAIGLDGGLYSWGSDDSGALCLGRTSTVSSTVSTPTRVTEPVEVAKNASRVDSGNLTTAVIDRDGNLHTCGENGSGQLGTGSGDDRYVLTAVAVGTMFVEVSMSDGFAVAIDGDGRLWSWGSDSSGQLGNGADGDQATPTRITG
jgi:hypothetical protein